MTNLLFEPFFGGLRGNIRTSSIARWKAHGQLPIRDSWTFFASSYDWDVISRYWRISEKVGHFERKFYLDGDVAPPPNHCRYQKTSVFATSQWKLRDSIFIHLDRVPACDRRTDGQTDGQTDGIAVGIYSALHCKQCGRAVKSNK